MIIGKLIVVAGIACGVLAGPDAAAQSAPVHPDFGPVLVSGRHASAPPELHSGARPQDQTSDVLLQLVIHNRRGEPEWLAEQSGVSPLRNVDQAAPPSTYLALHVDRLDGTDLLTVRQRLTSVGNLQVYAGAGLARAKYLDDDPQAKPLPVRRAHHLLGAAAEVGARAQIGDHVSFDAAVRWMGLGSGVTLLQSDTGPFSADPVMLGVTVGYRFR